MWKVRATTQQPDFSLKGTEPFKLLAELPLACPQSSHNFAADLELPQKPQVAGIEAANVIDLVLHHG
jgi:hypothetical protein